MTRAASALMMMAVACLLVAGLRALGFNSIFSVAVALAFHILHASYWTSVRGPPLSQPGLVMWLRNTGLRCMADDGAWLTVVTWLQTSWVPNLLWPVYVKRIHRAKHGRYD